MSDTLSPLFTWRSLVVDSGLPPTAKLVALCLSMHMSERGDSCYPSISTQCAETGLARTTVCSHLKLLEDSAFLCREKGTRGRSTRYVAVLPSPMSVLPSAVSALSSAVSVPEVVKEHDKKKDLAAASRPRNPVWDALEAVMGFSPQTETERTHFAKTVREIEKQVPEGASQEEIERAMFVRRRAFERHFTWLTFSHLQFRSKWAELGALAVGSGHPTSMAFPELPEGEEF